VHLDQPLHQRQPDPQAALRLFQRPLHLREHLEQAGHLVGRDADAAVLHRHHHLAPLPLGGQPDVTAALGVLGTVVQEVGKYLSQPGQVGVHDDRLLRQRDRRQRAGSAAGRREQKGLGSEMTKACVSRRKP
jgi:hypothetical protein